MKSASHIFVSACIGVCMAAGMATVMPGTPAFAADGAADKAADKASAKAQDKSAKNKAAVLPLAEVSSAPVKTVSGESDIRLEIGAAAPEETGFLVFQDASTDSDEEPTGFAFEAGASSNFTPRTGVAELQHSPAPGEAWLLSSFTPRSANAHLSLSYGPDTGEDIDRRLGIELSSSINVVPINVPGITNNATLLDAFARQEYNLGVNIGYQGFNLGASFKREYDEFSDGYSGGYSHGYSDGYRGFDVGFSYRAKSWSTSLSVGEYRRTYDNMLGEAGDLDNSFMAFELGASYNLSQAFRLTGGIRHFEYGADYMLEQDGVARAQIFYLGTRLNF